MRRFLPRPPTLRPHTPTPMPQQRSLARRTQQGASDSPMNPPQTMTGAAACAAAVLHGGGTWQQGELAVVVSSCLQVLSDQRR